MEGTGIVFYRRNGDKLVGRWSHPETRGLLADERVSGVEPGSFTGSWPVEICNPAGTLVYEGTLESVSFGESFKLSWRGNYVPSGKAADFEGFGCALDADTLCSSFAEVKPEECQAAG